MASPEYLARNPPPDSPKDLRGHRCIHFRHTWNGAIQRWMFEREGEQTEVAVDGAFVVNDMHLALAAARDGLGIANVPEAIAKPLIDDGRLVPLLEGWRGSEFDFFLYYSSRRQMPLALQTFIAFIHKHANGGANAKAKSDKQALRQISLEAAE